MFLGGMASLIYSIAFMKSLPHHNDGSAIKVRIIEVVSATEYDGVGEMCSSSDSIFSPWELLIRRMKLSEVKQ